MVARITHLALWVLLIVARIGAVPDAPYTEIVPERHTFASIKQVPGWGKLTVGNATQLLSIGLPGAFMMLGSDDQLYFVDSQASMELTLHPLISLDHQASIALLKSSATQSSIAVAHTSGPVTTISVISCSYGADAKPTCSETTEPSPQFAIGKVTSLVVASGQIFCAGSLGLVAWDPTTKKAPMWYLKQAVDALAVSASSSALAAGSDEKLWLYEATTSTPITTTSSKFKLSRWEWVTDIPSGAGGAVDDSITSLAYDADDNLYIGTPSCLNVRWTNRTFSR
jgi:hypothetical protein